MARWLKFRWGRWNVILLGRSAVVDIVPDEIGLVAQYLVYLCAGGADKVIWRLFAKRLRNKVKQIARQCSVNSRGAITVYFGP